MRTSRTFAVLCVLCLAAPAFAAHPLITDDTGTQGRGKVQLELVAEYSRAEDSGAVEKTFTVPTMPVLSVGLLDSLDIVSGIAYQHATIQDAESRVTRSGATDFALDFKWRFYDRGGLSLGLKPGITLPSGDDQKGLGAGRSTQHLLLLATKEAGPWKFHANAGWTRNANRAGDREGLWHASAAAARAVAGSLAAAVDLGVDTNPGPASRRMPAYALAGLVWAASERLDLDVGAKRSFNVPGTAWSVLAGMTARF